MDNAAENTAAVAGKKERWYVTMTHTDRQERQLLRPEDLGLSRWTREKGKRGRPSAAECAERDAHNALHGEIAGKLKELYDSEVMGDILGLQLSELRAYMKRKLQEATEEIAGLREQLVKSEQRLVAAHMIFSIERVFDGLAGLVGEPRVGNINDDVPGIIDFDIVGLRMRTVAGTNKVHVASAPETAIKIWMHFATYDTNGRFSADGLALLRFLAEAITPAGRERLGTLLGQEKLEEVYSEHQ